VTNSEASGTPRSLPSFTPRTSRLAPDDTAGSPKAHPSPGARDRSPVADDPLLDPHGAQAGAASVEPGAVGVVRWPAVALPGLVLRLPAAPDGPVGYDEGAPPSPLP
jgi:hypothetical protein